MAKEKKSKKHRRTWKWMCEEANGFMEDYYFLLCPHEPHITSSWSVLLESPTVRQEKFLMLMRLERDRKGYDDLIDPFLGCLKCRHSCTKWLDSI